MCKHESHLIYFHTYRLPAIFCSRMVCVFVYLCVYLCVLSGGRCSLEGVQQTVDAAHKFLSLASQSFLTLDVSILLHLPCHQPLRLLAGATHQFLHLAIQLLHLCNLRAWRGGGKSHFLRM